MGNGTPPYIQVSYSANSISRIKASFDAFMRMKLLRGGKMPDTPTVETSEMPSKDGFVFPHKPSINSLIK